MPLSSVLRPCYHGWLSCLLHSSQLPLGCYAPRIPPPAQMFLHKEQSQFGHVISETHLVSLLTQISLAPVSSMGSAMLQKSKLDPLLPYAPSTGVYTKFSCRFFQLPRMSLCCWQPRKSLFPMCTRRKFDKTIEIWFSIMPGLELFFTTLTVALIVP